MPIPEGIALKKWSGASVRTWAGEIWCLLGQLQIVGGRKKLKWDFSRNPNFSAHRDLDRQKSAKSYGTFWDTHILSQF